MMQEFFKESLVVRLMSLLLGFQKLIAADFFWAV
jgi:hypothetical protein